MTVTTYPNGLIPVSALDPIPALNGQTAWLLPGAAAAFLRVVDGCQSRYGWAPVVTSAGDGFRSLQRQIDVFTQRYQPRFASVWQGGRRVVDRRVWNGVAYYRHIGAAAAVPGTSNHGKGITVDVSGLGGFTSTRYAQFRTVAEAEGWSNAEGRSVSEPWHWNYTLDAYPVDNTNDLPPDVTITPVDGALPDPLDPVTPRREDDAMYRIRIKDGEQGAGRIYLVDLHRHRFIRLNPGASAGGDAIGLPTREVDYAGALAVRTLVVSLKDAANLDRIDFDL